MGTISVGIAYLSETRLSERRLRQQVRIVRGDEESGVFCIDAFGGWQGVGKVF